MTLWIGNGAVLQSSSQWKLKEFRKLNYSVLELFIFKILLKLVVLFRSFFLTALCKIYSWSSVTFIDVKSIAKKVVPS